MDRPSPVPAAPNEGLLRGRLVQVEPAPEGSVWTVAVEESDSLPGLPNLAQRYAGRSLRLLVPAGVSAPGLGERIEARVTFQGDERGAAFYLVGSEVRPLPAGPARQSTRTDGPAG